MLTFDVYFAYLCFPFFRLQMDNFFQSQIFIIFFLISCQLLTFFTLKHGGSSSCCQFSSMMNSVFLSSSCRVSFIPPSTSCLTSLFLVHLLSLTASQLTKLLFTPSSCLLSPSLLFCNRWLFSFLSSVNLSISPSLAVETPPSPETRLQTDAVQHQVKESALSDPTCC